MRASVRVRVRVRVSLTLPLTLTLTRTSSILRKRQSHVSAHAVVPSAICSASGLEAPWRSWVG